jgi:hypothetical protein
MSASRPFSPSGFLLLAVLCLAAPPIVAATAAEDGPAAPTLQLTTARAEALVKEISASVENLRGLKFKTPVNMKVIDGATARESFKSKIEPRTEELMRHAQRAYIQLGLIPRGTSLLSGYLDLAEKGVAGYYESGSKTFYLLDHVPADEIRGVIAHELTHALEDQHYDLKEIQKKAGGDDDRATAITAVIEGSAMVVQMAFLSREPENIKKMAIRKTEKDRTQRAERLKTAPSFTQRSLLMPYILGISFLLRGNIWNWSTDSGVRISDLDEVYAKPPGSTRQILHPEQYWQRAKKQWVPLTLPDLSGVLGKGWSKAVEGSIGELGLGVLTGGKIDFDSPTVILPTRWTSEPAEGTTGDLFHHYVNGDQGVTVLVTRWETAADAEQFERALINKGKMFFRYGVNFIVLAGDIGDKGEALAAAALEGVHYWPDE